MALFIRRKNKGNIRNALSYYFFIAMLPLAELRIAIPTGLTMNVPIIQTYIISLIGNMLPLPFVFYYSQKILSWGKDKNTLEVFLHSVWKRVNKQGKSLRKRLEEVCFLRWFFCWNSCSGNRSMDWNFGSKYIGAGFQRKHWSMLLWSSVGGCDHGCVKYGNFECDLVKHDI